MSEQQKRRGRPAKAPSERKRGNLTFRVRDDLRAALEEAAAQSDRSLSEEIEYRLELSLGQREALKEEWGPDAFAIAESIAKSLQHIERYTGKRWLKDEATFLLFSATVSELIRRYRDLATTNWDAPTSTGVAGQSPQEMAQIFAGLAGIRPPSMYNHAGFERVLEDLRENPAAQNALQEFADRRMRLENILTKAKTASPAAQTSNPKPKRTKS